MTSTTRVAAIQLNCSDDLLQNLQRVDEWVERARDAGAEVALLPENFAFFGPEAQRREVAEVLAEPNAPIQSALCRMAREYGIALIAGGWPERSLDPLRPYNTLTTYDNVGVLSGHYRKLHLFDVDLANGTTYRESESTTPGTDVAVSNLGGITYGLSICYDLRFPELYRKLSDLGAEVMCVPAAFTAETGRDHWHLLNRARAVESQSYVVAANQWGKHGRNRQSYGHTLIVDPWGTIVAEAPDRPGFVIADIDRDWIAEIRSRLPALRHRRLGL